MDSQPLDPSLEQQARALCAKITVAHDLDPEIQEELYSHIEDKLLGYLGGDIPLSGDDALLLVREHFGDPGAIKTLLQEVHATEAGLSQGRRLAAAAIATLGCVIVARLLLTTVSMGIQYLYLKAPAALDALNMGSTPLADTGTPALNPAYFVALILTSAAIMCLAPWAVFRRWQKRLRAGERPWFYRWGGWRLAGAAMGLLLLNQAIPFFALGGAAVGSKWAMPLAMLSAGALCLGQCVAWIGWCDAPPRTKRNAVNAAGAWLLGLSLISVLPRVSLVFTATPGGASGGPVGHALLHGRFLDTAGQITVWWSGASPYNLYSGAATFVFAGFLGAGAVALYGLAKVLRRRMQREHAGDRPGLT